MLDMGEPRTAMSQQAPTASEPVPATSELRTVSSEQRLATTPSKLSDAREHEFRGEVSDIFDFMSSKLYDLLYMDLEFLINLCKYSTIFLFMQHDKVKSIRLKDIIITHTLNRPNIIPKLNKRISQLSRIYESRTCEKLNGDILYSVTPIKVFKLNKFYYCLDGNSRIKAYQTFFTNNPIVDVYIMKYPPIFLPILELLFCERFQ